ncbi:hypothetical protein GCM10023192_38330 [Amycolatopsis samaneae]
MSALIYVSLEHIHPVVDGIWHRARLTEVPAPGEAVRMLCGLVAAAEYDDVRGRDLHGVPRQCWSCECVYREENGFVPPPGGYPPGCASELRSVPRPGPRRC